MERSIINSVKSLREYFNTGETKSITFRIQQLRLLKTAILYYKDEILEALWSDLRKSPEEGFVTEIAILIQEIDLHIKNLRKWGRPKRVASPLQLFPSRSYIYHEPLGVALIIAPWNYPFQLLINPLVGALSSGCAAILKTSPNAPATAKIVEKIIAKNYNSNYIYVQHGGKEENTALLKERFDMIFFTGSPQLGKIVYQAAAKHLTPVILELGGKSPCIVDKDADIAVSARRIIWGKLINAGQTCIAPDYLLVHKSVKDKLMQAIQEASTALYGLEIQKSRFYPRMVSEAAWERVTLLVEGEEKIVMGVPDGEVVMEKSDLFIAPMLLPNVLPDAPIMQEEIFGPVLPILTFEQLDQAVQYVAAHEKPLALYYFGKSGEEVLARTSSGGACINDTIMHVANHNLPFGGVGNSGMGRYHGKRSFELFSNQRAVVKTPTWLDLPLKYPPFRYFSWIRRVM